MNPFIVIILLILLVLATIISLTWHGWEKYTMSAWDVCQTENLKDWDDIFSKSQDMKLLALSMGISKSQPGARSYLRAESIPDDYDVNTIDTPPTISFAVNHPVKGDVLFDAGLNRHFYKNDSGDLPLVMKLYQKISRYCYEAAETENMQYYINKHNLNPGHVFVSHLHPDHVSGLSEIVEDATVVFGKKENTFYYKMISGKYLRTQKNIKTLDFSRADSLAPFSKVIDLFGDASILAISSPGHTADHISYFINDTDNPALIVGDLTLSEDFLKQGIESSVDSKKTGANQLHQSIKELREFMRLYPQVKIYYSHNHVR